MGWLRRVLTVLALGSYVAGEFAKRTINGSTIRFSVAPVKAAQASESAQNESCIRWQSSAATTVMSVQIRRKDRPTYDIDQNRFGPTSVQLGRQKLQLRITDPQRSGELILKDGNVPVAGRSLMFSTNNLSSLDICFSNLSFDSSWNAIDMLVELDVTVYPVQRVNTLPVSPVADRELDLLRMAVQDLYDSVDRDLVQALVSSEEARRDFNESSYSWLMYRFVILTAGMLTACCLVVPTYLMYLSHAAGGRPSHKCQSSFQNIAHRYKCFRPPKPLE